ncbi:hypothetical protein M378DRAFT_169784 [Amanita muscaria Koide BX008]|uniref:Uncharacterized protein n=1 Tax=Amanita muscaria (strain Koide BX008) TaxID=946122 RepID=A0A0C2WCU1_AMAMK|nr:hypothetical protein M378DRAFT_169784 [Amanita muscaria Koide BX008]
MLPGNMVVIKVGCGKSGNCVPQRPHPARCSLRCSSSVGFPSIFSDFVCLARSNKTHRMIVAKLASSKKQDVWLFQSAQILSIKVSGVPTSISGES